jgi:adenylylsulfate kinase
MRSGSRRRPIRGGAGRAREGSIVWLTGIPAAGKSTAARALRDLMEPMGLVVAVLDGDALRRSICSGLGFSRKDRDENIRRIGRRARALAAAGVWAIVAAVSPYRAARERERRMASLRRIRFIEAYVKCPLRAAERRDPKGLYRMARKGKISNMTGVSDPYEAPAAPDIVLETARLSANGCARRLLRVVLGKKNHLRT